MSKPQNVEEEEEEKKYDEFQVEKDYPEMKKSIFYAEEKEKEEKKVKNDELLFLKVSASALLLVLKRISDQAFLNSQKSSGAVKFDNTSSILLLKLKLQLLLFPLATPSAKSSIDCESAYNTTFGSMFHSPIMKSSATIIEHCKKEESRIDVGDKDKVILTLEALPERGMKRRDEFSEIYKYGTIQGQSAYAKQSGCYDTATSSSSIPKALSANVSISSGNATVTRMTRSNVECSTTGGRGDSQAVTYPSSSSSSPPPPPPPLLLSPSTTQTPSFTSIHKALEVFEKIPSNKAVVTAAAAVAAAASTGTSTKISSVFSTGQVGLCNPDEETVTHEPTTLRDYSTELRELLTILIASQDALSEILNLLTTQHHTIIKSIPPTTSPYTAKYSHRDKKKNGDVSIGINFSSAKMGRKSPEKKGEGVKEDNVSDEERIWIDLMTLCGHLQCTACTCALLFFSSTFSQRSTELCFVEKHISSSSPEVMLMLFEIPFSRLLAFESYVKSNIKYQSNGSAHSEKKGNVEIGEIEDEVDDFQEMCDHYQYHQYASDELWAILIHILGNFAPLALPDPKPKVSAPFNLEYAGWGLGQVLLQWIRCGIPIVMFERKVSDLSTESDRFISDQTKSKNLVIILRLLLFTWRVRVPERTIPESIYIKKESIGQSQEDSSVGCLSECLPTHLSFNTRLISQSIWLKEVHAIRFSTHFLLKIASLK